MSQRFTLFSLLCLFLMGIGAWLYMQAANNERLFGAWQLHDFHVAVYWFALLVFLLFSLLFYVFAGKRSFLVWLIALLIAAGISITTTSILVTQALDGAKQKEFKEEASNLALPLLDK